MGLRNSVYAASSCSRKALLCVFCVMSQNIKSQTVAPKKYPKDIGRYFKLEAVVFCVGRFVAQDELRSYTRSPRAVRTSNEPSVKQPRRCSPYLTRRRNAMLRSSRAQQILPLKDLRQLALNLQIPLYLSNHSYPALTRSDKVNNTPHFRQSFGYICE